jgi:hypothetical protein
MFQEILEQDIVDVRQILMHREFISVLKFKEGDEQDETEKEMREKKELLMKR